MTWETNPEGHGKPISENLITRENLGPLLDLFIKKDKTKSIAEQSKIKNRMVLWPRGGMKTSCDIADIVQWILNFPEIRILVLTAADDLAVAILDEMRGHFLEKDGEPTLMNIYFPEFCVPEKHLGAAGLFECPVWLDKQVKRKEPTVMASSITSTISGFHFELIKADDTVETRNSFNEEQCKKVSSNFSINKKTLRYFGYCDKIGTRYHEEDMYGQDIIQNIGEKKTTTGPGWELIENESTGTLILIGRAIQIKPEIKAEYERRDEKPSYLDVGEENCELLMPKVLGFSRLMSMYNEDERVFEGQMNQNCRPSSTVVYDRNLLEKCTVMYHEVPSSGPIAHFWDLAYSDKIGRDYTTAVSVRWDSNGVAYVHDLVRRRYPNDLELAKAIVDFTNKWRPQIVGIEDSPGAKFLGTTLEFTARNSRNMEVILALGRNSIDWAQVDRKLAAKKRRLGSLHPLLATGRLKFANYIPDLDTLYDEFERCMTSAKHDDIPDSISYAVRYESRFSHTFQQMKLMQSMNGQYSDKEVERLKADIQAEHNKYAENAWRNLIFEENTDAFGRPGYAVPKISEPVTEPEFGSEPTIYGDHMLGAGLE